MAGKIVADQLQHSTAGTVDTQFVVNGSAKARLMFDHLNGPTIDGSLNISSVTDSATGQSQPFFTNNISLGFSTVATGADTSSGQSDSSVRGSSTSAQVTNYYKVYYYKSTTATDDELLSSVTFGDLI